MFYSLARYHISHDRGLSLISVASLLLLRNVCSRQSLLHRAFREFGPVERALFLLRFGLADKIPFDSKPGRHA